MKQVKKTETLSLVFFLILIILLPIILTVNNEEKVILSKAEETFQATPSATIVPISPYIFVSPTFSSPSPTSVVPTVPRPTAPVPTLVVPTIASQPSSVSAQITISPLPTIIPSLQIFPTVYISPTAVMPTTPVTVQERTIQNGWGINQAVDFVVSFFGLKTKPEVSVNQVNNSDLALIYTSTEMELQPIKNSAQYTKADFLEKDVADNIIGEWLDRLTKKNRQRVVQYEIIINPDGFVYTGDVILTVKTNQSDFDEPIFRQQTLTKTIMNQPYYFDRYGFFEDLSEAQAFYASFTADHNRIHAVTVKRTGGESTNRDTKLTFIEWDSLGVNQLKDSQGLSVTDAIRNQTNLIRQRFPDFNPSSSVLNLYDLSEIINWLNSQSTGLIPITQTDLVQLLNKDDVVVVVVMR